MRKYFLFAVFLLVPLSHAHATVLYVDFTCATDGIGCGNGTSTTTPYASLDQFAEVSRSAGDIAFVRRGVASTTNGSALVPTSSGGASNPLIIEADYDNLWNDFASSTQTFTIETASTSMLASASTTGIVAGNWIYAQSDCFETATTSASFGYNDCPFAYEVKSLDANTGTINLYLPYKGKQSGSGNNLRVMPSAPQWGTTAVANFKWNMIASHWLIKGLDLRMSTNSNCLIGVGGGGTQSQDINLIDDIITLGNNSTQSAICEGGNSGYGEVYASKLRTLNGLLTDEGQAGIGTLNLTVNDCYVDIGGIGVTPIRTASTFTASHLFANINNCQFWGLGTNDLVGQNTTNESLVYLNGVFRSGTGKIVTSPQNNSGSFPVGIFVRDDQFVNFTTTPGLNVYSNVLSRATGLDAIQSTTTVTRSGGGPISEYVQPSASLNTKALVQQLRLFEYPIYTDTSSKTYTVFFESTSTTAFTANPTNKELWIECERWANTNNATSTRSITKSTGTIDFAGTSGWQSLAVTCTPSKTGILYLRGWYAKTKEANSNYFFVDGTPVIQ